MQTAVYGRMRKGRCVQYDIQLGCSADVRGVLDSKCSGRRQCNVKINDDFMELSSCPRELRGYLEATYSCRKCECKRGCTRNLSRCEIN